MYNASYLTREFSEQALDILTRVEQRTGIVASVPEGTVVAHKFGEAGSFDSARQYHDCGIVYHPKRHYLICIMSKGGDIDALTSAVRDISQLVWSEVEKQTGK